MTTDLDKDYLHKLKEYIDQLEINNEVIDCVLVNPKDYNKYIAPSGNCTFVNYDKAPFFGRIDPPRIYGIPIRVSGSVPEGNFIKITAAYPYVPLQVSKIVFNDDGSVTVDRDFSLENLKK
jgi:phosphoribulokinase